jgi:DNA-binding beta-propeller fold protein YncE
MGAVGKRSLYSSRMCLSRDQEIPHAILQSDLGIDNSLEFFCCVGAINFCRSTYKVLKKERVGGEGRFDYVFADSVGRRLFIPRNDGANSRITVFNLDTLAPLGEVPKTIGARGAIVDPKSGHGFSSSKPVVMFDAKNLETLKTIDIEGDPDGILFDPATERVFVFSHSAPNATVLNAADGTIIGTMDLGGAPEQAVSDLNGKLYVDLEDNDRIAVVDANKLQMIGNYDISASGKGPAGLAIDRKNGILFACCRNPATMVILAVADGKIITSLPIGAGCDGAVFNPDTLEVFSSQRDGTLSVIRETSPDSFAVQQSVDTMPGAKTLSLDAQTGQIFLIAAEQSPAAAQPAGEGAAAPRGARRAQVIPGSFTILVVGK